MCDRDGGYLLSLTSPSTLNVTPSFFLLVSYESPFSPFFPSTFSSAIFGVSDSFPVSDSSLIVSGLDEGVTRGHMGSDGVGGRGHVSRSL